nr:MAG TPA: hypothetical protein [Caudoviricetes sp.]
MSFQYWVKSCLVAIVLRTTGGSVLLIAATPTTSAMSTATATPTITTPTTVMACPSDSATSYRSVGVTPLGEIRTFCRGRACTLPKG